MIYITLTGGLGNQMFQYAYGLALASRHGVPFRLDLTRLEDHTEPRPGFTPRRYSLDCFQCPFPIASRDELSRFRTKWGWRISRFNSLLIRLGLRPVGHVLLDGYWQDHTLFKRVVGQLREHFRFQPLRTPAAIEWVREIQIGKPSICVHVRRGDYSGNMLHEVCTPGYYRDAVDHLWEKTGGFATIFVFSDNIDWCRQHLHFSQEVRFISSDLAQDETLHLMSLCDHYVISNSSFSWWAVWLNRDGTKQVVSPSRWLNHEPENSALVKGLILSEWHVINT